MLWARMVAYVTGTVNQELLLRNEYLGAENRISSSGRTIRTSKIPPAPEVIGGLSSNPPGRTTSSQSNKGDLNSPGKWMCLAVPSCNVRR
jgi:hypothetical protein